MTDDPVQPAAAPASGKTAKRRSKRKKAKAKNGSKRVRVARIYPALSFEESLPLAEAIHTHAAGERVSRLTLLIVSQRVVYES
jgi:hypothetical protein